MYSLLVQVVALACGISHVQGFIFLREYLEGDQSFEQPSLQDNHAMWIEQKVDHFNDNDDRKFKQKYYKQMDFWKPGGPIVLYFNGMDPLKYTSYSDKNESLIIQICKETGGALFTLEHRYYGDSQPFNDQTVENLIFLTSRQTLADAAYLLQNIKNSSEFSTAKVLVIGGNYAGNYAVWMKLMYPKLVDAVLSSSAPLLAKKDFAEFNEAVTDTYRKYGSQHCVNKISETYQTYITLLQTDDGREKVKKSNYICDNVDMSVPENQQFFFKVLILPHQFVAQYLTPKDVDELCKGYHRKFQYLTARNEKDDYCNNFDLSTYKHGIYKGDRRTFFYQSCTEFGHFLTAQSDKQLFGKIIPLSLFYRLCKLSFGDDFGEERVDQGVKKTNEMFQGQTPAVEHVVFVNGDMDPYSKLGVVHDLSPEAPSVHIMGSSTCHDLNPDPSDADNIKEAREKIKGYIKSWLGTK